jgi:hypothetical protein
MSSKIVLIAAAAAVAAAGIIPVGFATAGSSDASTAECGLPCTSPFNESEGSGEVLTVSGSGVELAPSSTTNSAQDWTVEVEGTVSAAVADGILSPRLNLLYGGGGEGGDSIVEYQYAPNGAPSGSCLSDDDQLFQDGSTGSDNTYYYDPTLTVTLAPCGITAQSLWIVDDSSSGSEDGYVDLINAGYQAFYQYGFSGDAGTNYTYTSGGTTYNDDGGFSSPFAEPAVLTVNSSGKVVLAQLSEIGGVVNTTQMWGDYLAADNSALRKAIEAKAR